MLWANKALDILSFVLSQGRVSREPFPGSLYAVFVDFGERSSGIVRERRVHVHGQGVFGRGSWAVETSQVYHIKTGGTT